LDSPQVPIRLWVDRGDRRPCSGSGSGDRGGRLPLQAGGFGRDPVYAQCDVFGLRFPRRESDDLVADREFVHTGTDLGDISGEVVALSLGEVRRPDVGETPFANTDLTRIGGRGHHRHHHLPWTRRRAGNLDDVEDLRSAVAGELDRPHHSCPGCA
jgi:hypothetical protein